MYRKFDEFADGINTIRKISASIEAILCSIPKDDVWCDEVVHRMADCAAFGEEDGRYASLYVSRTKAWYKTFDGTSFGWMAAEMSGDPVVFYVRRPVNENTPISKSEFVKSALANGFLFEPDEEAELNAELARSLSVPPSSSERKSKKSLRVKQNSRKATRGL